jgi:hypothetical protein
MATVSYTTSRDTTLSFPGIDIPLRFRPSPLHLGQRLFDPQLRPESFRIECFEAFDYDLF